MTSAAPRPPVYTSKGKEVLVDQWHYADAVSEEAARRIAEAMNARETAGTPSTVGAAG